jgi:uncharacterized protein YyaL (SSP411 family)
LSEQKNRLANSHSPYLRSAAHQPIDWYEWGEEAFDRARAENKPILLDIGAVWCHWCHVIDRESYENPEIAAIIKELFVAVKVDRDERPDVDARYQSAISAVSGQGGWPLTGFLLPDGRPFFGGTYFPPEDAMGRPGFRRILRAVADAYDKKRGELETAADALSQAVAQAESFVGARDKVDSGVATQMVQSIVATYDSRNGGFGRAPKFPHPQAMDLLLDEYQATREPRLLEIAKNTLTKMASGGVYDQLAGGFHRYSVDERWLVPHFEKMSYDNSELLRNYLHGWQVTRDPFLRATAEGIVGWVNSVLSDQQRGGFYASQDADVSLDDDGDYFTWTLDELRSVLTGDESRAAELRFDVEAHGEMHHNPAKNVMWIARGVEEIAAQMQRNAEDVRLLLASAERKMLAARKIRVTPFVDTTMYVAWNAMFCSAYLEAANVLGGKIGEDCRGFALKTLDRLLNEARGEDLRFGHRIGGPWLAGSLDDQVFTALALLDAYETTLDSRYYAAAEAAMLKTLEQYWDAEHGGFFDRAADAPAMGGLDVRRKAMQDSPTPASNGVAAMVLTRLYGYTGNKLYRDRAEGTLEAFAGAAPKYGMFAASYGLAVSLHSRGAIQVVVTGRADDPAANALERAATETYRFGKAVLRLTPEKQTSAWLAPMLSMTLPHLRADVAAAMVCVETKCHPPVTTAEQLTALLLNQKRGANAD